MRWIDVSIPLKPGLTIWPGDTPYAFTPGSRIAEGAPCNVSSITMSTHAGTHVDAPWHFEDDGKRLHSVNTDIFFGEVRVIEYKRKNPVSAIDLGEEKLPPRILLKTANSQRPLDAPFTEDYIAVDAWAARRMADEGVRLVGVDYLSIAPFDSDDQATHHILLQNDVFIVEGLRLADIPPGDHQFVVLPLALHDADGAPCRAFVGIE